MQLAQLWKPGLAIALCCLGVVRLLSGRAIDHPPGVMVRAEPSQTATHAPAFSLGHYEIEPRADYDIEARVLSVEPYGMDSGARLSPLDFAVGWGPMSDSAVLEHFRIRQGGRFFTLYPDEQAIDLRTALRGSANMHVIPASDELRRQLEHVRPGHLVHMRGMLVNISGPDGYRWRTSLTRLDTGDGACELFYVESVELLEQS
jgi:hypothetical protein